MKTNSSPQIPSLSRRIIFWGAAYDVLVTAAFATPWTAAWALQNLSSLHERFGLAGTALPVVDPVTMLFSGRVPDHPGSGGLKRVRFFAS